MKEESSTLRSGGGTLALWVDVGEPGDTFVVLDRDGKELGRAVTTQSTTKGFVRAEFEPAVELPPRGDLYEVRRIPKAEAPPAC